jgi:hypothetical protein
MDDSEFSIVSSGGASPSLIAVPSSESLHRNNSCSSGPVEDVQILLTDPANFCLLLERLQDSSSTCCFYLWSDHLILQTVNGEAVHEPGTFIVETILENAGFAWSKLPTAKLMFLSRHNLSHLVHFLKWEVVGHANFVLLTWITPLPPFTNKTLRVDLHYPCAALDASRLDTCSVNHNFVRHVMTCASASPLVHGAEDNEDEKTKMSLEEEDEEEADDNGEDTDNGDFEEGEQNDDHEEAKHQPKKKMHKTNKKPKIKPKMSTSNNSPPTVKKKKGRPPKVPKVVDSIAILAVPELTTPSQIPTVESDVMTIFTLSKISKEEIITEEKDSLPTTPTTPTTMIIQKKRKLSTKTKLPKTAKKKQKMERSGVIMKKTKSKTKTKIKKRTKGRSALPSSHSGLSCAVHTIIPANCDVNEQFCDIRSLQQLESYPLAFRFPSNEFYSQTREIAVVGAGSHVLYELQRDKMVVSTLGEGGGQCYVAPFCLQATPQSNPFREIFSSSLSAPLPEDGDLPTCGDWEVLGVCQNDVDTTKTSLQGGFSSLYPVTLFKLGTRMLFGCSTHLGIFVQPKSDQPMLMASRAHPYRYLCIHILHVDRKSILNQHQIQQSNHHNQVIPTLTSAFTTTPPQLALLTTTI